MPNGMEHVDWGHEASGRVHDLRKEFEAHRQLEQGLSMGIMMRIEDIEKRLKALEDKLNA